MPSCMSNHSRYASAFYNTLYVVPVLIFTLLEKLKMLFLFKEFTPCLEKHSPFFLGDLLNGLEKKNWKDTGDNCLSTHLGLCSMCPHVCLCVCMPLYTVICVFCISDTYLIHIIYPFKHIKALLSGDFSVIILYLHTLIKSYGLCREPARNLNLY